MASTSDRHGTLYLGAPLWTEKRWIGNFFPAGSKPAKALHLYSRRLPAVEGNTTYYGIPSEETLSRWRDETPLGFQFCFKFPKAISHEKRLHETDRITDVWVERLRLLGDRAGPSFLQLPPSFGPQQLPLLSTYLERLPRDLPFAVEVRNQGWYTTSGEAALNALLAACGIARVNYDVRPLRTGGAIDAATREALAVKPEVPVTFLRTAPFTFVRYVAHPDAQHSEPMLAEWTRTVAAWLQSGVDVYFFVQHPDDFFGPAVCRQFHERVRRAFPSLPPLPDWPSPGAEQERQGKLL